MGTRERPFKVIVTPGFDAKGVVDRLVENHEFKLAERRRVKREQRAHRYATDPEYRASERERSKLAARRTHQKRGTAERLYRSAVLRAKRTGVRFNLTLSDIRQLWPHDGRCPVLGFRMLLDGERDVLPTLDRFDPNRGYELGNVRIISYRANRLKSDSWKEELARVLAYTMSRDPMAYTFRDGDHVVEYVKGFDVFEPEGE